MGGAEHKSCVRLSQNGGTHACSAIVQATAPHLAQLQSVEGGIGPSSDLHVGGGRGSWSESVARLAQSSLEEYQPRHLPSCSHLKGDEASLERRGAPHGGNLAWGGRPRKGATHWVGGGAAAGQRVANADGDIVQAACRQVGNAALSIQCRNFVRTNAA